jgi:hypothetical protein
MNDSTLPHEAADLALIAEGLCELCERRPEILQANPAPARKAIRSGAVRARAANPPVADIHAARVAL